MSCNASYLLEHILHSCDIPYCAKCGGVVKPDVVLYEEGLDQITIGHAVNYIKNADMLIIGGTSLMVYPAAGLVNYYSGNKLVVINKTETHVNKKANLVICGSIGEVLQKSVDTEDSI